MELAEETVRVQGGKTRPRTLAYLVFTGLKSSTSCVIFQECPMALCLLAPFWEGSKERATTAPPWEVREGHTGPKLAGAKRRLFLTEQRRVSSPCVGPCGRFPPQVGERPVPARSGAIWAPQGPVWQNEKKPPPLPVRGEFGGDSQAGERPGVAGASPAGSPRPAEPVVAGFLPSSTDQKIRGRLGGLGVTIGVRNTKFPGGKPFFRVSPPGSTKG